MLHKLIVNAQKYVQMSIPDRLCLRLDNFHTTKGLITHAHMPNRETSETEQELLSIAFTCKQWLYYIHSIELTLLYRVYKHSGYRVLSIRVLKKHPFLSKYPSLGG